MKMQQLLVSEHPNERQRSGPTHVHMSVSDAVPTEKNYQKLIKEATVGVFRRIVLLPFGRLRMALANDTAPKASQKYIATA